MWRNQYLCNVHDTILVCVWNSVDVNVASRLWKSCGRVVTRSCLSRSRGRSRRRRALCLPVDGGQLLDAIAERRERAELWVARQVLSLLGAYWQDHVAVLVAHAHV